MKNTFLLNARLFIHRFFSYFNPFKLSVGVFFFCFHLKSKLSAYTQLLVLFAEDFQPKILGECLFKQLFFWEK